MTKEEALEYGKMWLEMQEDSQNSKTYEFFAIAVKALEQYSVLDKIKAEIEEPLKINESLHTESAKAQAISLSWCCEIIDRAKHWDGHTEKDVTRLLSLEKEPTLDKIRERVELEKLGYPPSAEYYKAIMKVLQIIDKERETKYADDRK